MFRFKRAQAAMEFLMTYGWAILVVLVVIGALSYFGVLSPSTLLPEKCTFPVSVSCTDHTVVGGASPYMAIILQNGAGRDIIVRGVTASGDGYTHAADEICSTETDDNGIPQIDDKCPISTGLGVKGCIGSSTLRNGASTTISLTENNCVVIDTGRDKNRYNVTVWYSWLDSKTIMHQLPGELLARTS